TKVINPMCLPERFPSTWALVVGAGQLDLTQKRGQVHLHPFAWDSHSLTPSRRAVPTTRPPRARSYVMNRPKPEDAAVINQVLSMRPYRSVGAIRLWAASARHWRCSRADAQPTRCREAARCSVNVAAATRARLASAWRPGAR